MDKSTAIDLVFFVALASCQWVDFLPKNAPIVGCVSAADAGGEINNWKHLQQDQGY